MKENYKHDKIKFSFKNKHDAPKQIQYKSWKSGKVWFFAASSVAFLTGVPLVNQAISSADSTTISEQNFSEEKEDDELVGEVTATITYKRYQVYDDSRLAFQGRLADDFSYEEQTFTVTITGMRDVDEPELIDWQVDRDQILTADEAFFGLPTFDGYNLIDEGVVPWEATIDLGTVVDSTLWMTSMTSQDGKHIDFIPYDMIEDMNESNTKYFYYTPNVQKYAINYVNEMGETLKSNILTGLTYETIDYPLDLPTGYELTQDANSENVVSLVFDAQDAIDQVYTIEIRQRADVDTDGDGVPDRLEIETGTDAKLDNRVPQTYDNDEDGEVNWLDANNNGIWDKGEQIDLDIDGDSVPNIEDPDIDGDGILNTEDTTPYGIRSEVIVELPSTSTTPETDRPLSDSNLPQNARQSETVAPTQAISYPVMPNQAPTVASLSVTSPVMESTTADTAPTSSVSAQSKAEQDEKSTERRSSIPEPLPDTEGTLEEELSLPIAFSVGIGVLVGGALMGYLTRKRDFDN
ncbi:hypothetical protein Hs30E_14400 [Lactococcus hodotermopsidis]|uniref:Mucin binding domain-containing protein n=1 Tax=Pseudolactococcus hodotermopsidis TaxID=2709157 RepID=A0A6A0BBR7_9LACT|nr:KxYKxGKxW signal peptide domain-containing protein [Lactococcus hodotermopsidis]GFH42889.1 hypothetical protein Hs30E_14400 [Lactococcus hodotermopsidis]